MSLSGANKRKYSNYLKKFDQYLYKLEKYERQYGHVSNAQRSPFTISDILSLFEQTQIGAQTQKTCPAFSKGEDAAMKMMKHYCPGGYKQEWIPIFLDAIEKSKVFSKRFKDWAKNHIKSLQTAKSLKKGAALPPVVVDKKDEVVTIDLTTFSQNGTNIEVDRILPVTYKAQFNPISSLIMKNKPKPSNYEIRVRVIDLTNLQQYGDDPLLYPFFESCVNPNVVEQVIRDMESCVVDYHYQVDPKFVVVVENVRFLEDGQRYRTVVAQTEELKTTKDMKAKIVLHGYGRESKTNAPETYDVQIGRMTKTNIPFSQ